MTSEAELELQERVLETQIYNVRYRVEDARIFDEKTIILGSGAAINDADVATTLNITIAYEITRSFSFSNSSSTTTGVPTTITAGIPRIVEGKIEISPEVTMSFEWGKTSTETLSAQVTYTVTVPAKSRVRVNYVATYGRCSVPFSYTQRDKMSDGVFVTSQRTDGIFNADDYYDLRFEQPPVEPL